MTSTKINRFYSLDVLRGFAALSVVFWHWQHFFFFDGGARRIGVPDQYPFHAVAELFYTRGYMAVDLFFAISGFVFFWLYSRAVATRQMGVTRFMLLRLSRLYPLHVAMLLLLAGLQIYFINTTGSPFVYPYNTKYTFLEHLTFLNVWTTGGVQSFNGPAWSISTEIFLYVLFVLACRYLPMRAWMLAVIVVVGEIVTEKIFFLAVRGVEPFFLGGLMYFAYETILKKEAVKTWSRIVIPITLAAWVVGCTVSLSSVTPQDVTALFPRAEHRVTLVFEGFGPLIIFPLTVLSLALAETARGHLGRRFAVIGDLSFSSYLIHFPLQLIAVIVAGWLSIDRNVFYSPWAMIGFFAVLIPLSIGSHRFFEMPVQAYLRSKLSSSRSRVTVAT